jgi:signal transduction histidine kinase
MTSKRLPSFAKADPAPLLSKRLDSGPANARLSAAGAALPPEAVHLLNNGPPMYMASLDGRLIYTNQQYHHLQHLTAVRRAGILAAEMVPAFPIADIIQEIIADGRTIRREDVVETATDAEFFTSQHHPVRDERGSIIAVAGVYQNATREAQAWTETLAARDRFRDVARLVLDWIWETDPAFNFTYVSPRIIEILKLHPRQLQNTSLFALGRFKPNEDGARMPRTDSAAALPNRDTRTAFRDVPFEIPGHEGETRLFLMSGLPTFDEKSGAFRGYRGTARDITVETQVRYQAERSSRRLAETIENISEGLALRDSRASLNLCNSKFREFFAPIADTMMTKMAFGRFLALVKEAGIIAGPADAFDTWCAESAPGGMLAGPLELHLADGRWIKVTESRSVKGGVITVLSDITDLKRREEALMAAKHLAERASRSKGEFLANMSHELRTPLNAVIGFSEIMRAETFGPLGNARYMDYIKDIHDSSRHLLGVINDILDISKSEAGKLQLNEATTDLLDEIRGAARLFGEQAHEERLTIRFDLPPALPLVWADARKIKQVLLNLLSNAVKFTPAGGTVTIGARQDGTNGDIIMTVADTGIGIAPQDMDKVFSTFGQVENSLSRRHEGTGLGLPLSRALVEIHGGTLALDSQPGRGTTVTVRLPASRLRR